MRPLNLGETLDASIKIVRRRWRTLALVMVVVSLPIQLLDLAIVSATTDTYQVGTSSFSADTSGTKTTYSDESAYVGGQIAIQVLSLIGYLLGTVACYRAIADTYLGGETGVRESLRFAAGRAGATLWLSLVLVVGLLGAYLALVIPGIWLTIAWSVAIPVLLVEGLRGTKALGRSFALVKDHWWATLGRLLVAYILVSVVTFVVAFALLAPAVAVIDDTSFAALVIEHVANFLVSLITTPFIAAVTMLVYFDLRVRKEGFDPAQLAERDAFGNPIGPTPAPASPPAFGQGWAPPVAPEPRRPPAS
jgi:hypothetical protein